MFAAQGWLMGKYFEFSLDYAEATGAEMDEKESFITQATLFFFMKFFILVLSYTLGLRTYVALLPC